MHQCVTITYITTHTPHARCAYDVIKNNADVTGEERAKKNRISPLLGSYVRDIACLEITHRSSRKLRFGELRKTASRYRFCQTKKSMSSLVELVNKKRVPLLNEKGYELYVIYPEELRRKGIPLWTLV